MKIQFWIVFLSLTFFSQKSATIASLPSSHAPLHVYEIYFSFPRLTSLFSCRWSYHIIFSFYSADFEMQIFIVSENFFSLYWRAQLGNLANFNLFFFPTFWNLSHSSIRLSSVSKKSNLTKFELLGGRRRKVRCANDKATIFYYDNFSAFSILCDKIRAWNFLLPVCSFSSRFRNPRWHHINGKVTYTSNISILISRETFNLAS